LSRVLNFRLKGRHRASATGRCRRLEEPIDTDANGDSRVGELIGCRSKRLAIIRNSAVVTAAMLLAACGGGGGVNSAGGAAPAPMPSVTPTPVPTPTPTSAADTAEYRASGAVVGMKAAYAYDRWITGKGVTIAVIDTGINVGEAEFKGRISAESTSFDQKIARCGTCDAEIVRYDLKDNNGHGSGTASVALAARDAKGMQGVAPEATLLALKIAGPDMSNVSPTSGPVPEGGGPNAALIAPAITYAVEKGAFVISMSLNGFAGGHIAVEQRKAMDLVRTSDRLFVNSVSNDVSVDSFAGQIAENLVGTDLANKDWFLFGIRVDRNLQAPSGNGIVPVEMLLVRGRRAEGPHAVHGDVDSGFVLVHAGILSNRQVILMQQGMGCFAPRQPTELKV